jgi:TusA-related sulfurtransferase
MVPSSAGDPQLLDLRGVRCPLNFVRAKVALGRLALGEELELVLDAGEPADSVLRALRDEGQTVLDLGARPDASEVRFLVQRAV